MIVLLLPNTCLQSQLVASQHKPASLAGQHRQVTPTLKCQSHMFGSLLRAYTYMFFELTMMQNTLVSMSHESLPTALCLLEHVLHSAVRNMQEGHCFAPCMLHFAMTCTVPCWGHTPYGHQ